MSDHGRTHSEGCWKRHPGCAVPYVERLEAEVERLREEREEGWRQARKRDVAGVFRERDRYREALERIDCGKPDCPYRECRTARAALDGDDR